MTPVQSARMMTAQQWHPFIYFCIIIFFPRLDKEMLLPLMPTVRILIMSIVFITMEADMQHLQRGDWRLDLTSTLVTFLAVCYTI